MKNLIYNMGLNVIEFDDAAIHTGKSSPTIFEVLEVAFLKAQAIIVLCTGDENVYLKKELAKNGQEEQNRMQPRPNVIFEAGKEIEIGQLLYLMILSKCFQIYKVSII